MNTVTELRLNLERARTMLATGPVLGLPADIQLELQRTLDHAFDWLTTVPKHDTPTRDAPASAGAGATDLRGPRHGDDGDPAMEGR